MKRSRILLAGVALCLTSTRCRRDGIFALLRDSDVEFRTDRSSYTIRVTSAGLAVDIPFRLTNGTGRTLHVVNCNRIAPPMLEKRVGDTWVEAWYAVVPACLSPAILIRAGETYADTLRVFAGLPSSNVAPQFNVQEIEGTYRLVWPGVLYSFDPNRYPFGEELPRELRTSHEFMLEDPR